MTEGGVGWRCRIIAGARFGVSENGRYYGLEIAGDAMTVVMKYRRHSGNVLRTRVAGDQVLDQLAADKRRHGRLRH